MEGIYVLVAIVVGWALYRYFSGHDGVRLSRSTFAGLPLDGAVLALDRPIRWNATEGGSFAAAWPGPRGSWRAIRVLFDDEADDDADPEQGRLDLTDSGRSVAQAIEWTDGISDRALREDVEVVLQILAVQAKRARTMAAGAGGARAVGKRPPIE